MQRYLDTPPRPRPAETNPGPLIRKGSDRTIYAPHERPHPIADCQQIHIRTLVGKSRHVQTVRDQSALVQAHGGLSMTEISELPANWQSWMKRATLDEGLKNIAENPFSESAKQTIRMALRCPLNQHTNLSRIDGAFYQLIQPPYARCTQVRLTVCSLIKA